MRSSQRAARQPSAAFGSAISQRTARTRSRGDGESRPTRRSPDAGKSSSSRYACRGQMVLSSRTFRSAQMAATSRKRTAKSCSGLVCVDGAVDAADEDEQSDRQTGDPGPHALRAAASRTLRRSARWRPGRRRRGSSARPSPGNSPGSAARSRSASSTAVMSRSPSTAGNRRSSTRASASGRNSTISRRTTLTASTATKPPARRTSNVAADAAGRFLHPVEAERLEDAEIEEQSDPEPEGQVDADDANPSSAT